MIFANLLHLSYNMWCDWQNPAVKSPYYAAQPYLRFDDKLWDDLLAAMKKAGLNMVVIDLGDGVNRATQSKAVTRQVFRAPGTVCR